MSKDDFSAIGAVIRNVSRADKKQGEIEEDVLEDGKKKFQKEVHYLAVWALKLGAILLGLVILIRFWHMVGPTYCRWLGPENIQEVDKMLFSSVFGGMVLNYLRDVMQPAKR